MKRSLKLWVGIGLSTWASVGPALSAGADPLALNGSAVHPLAAQDAAGAAGEGGGEAGAIDMGQPYALNSTDPHAFQYDASAVISVYAAQASSAYAENLKGAETLAAAVEQLLVKPSAEHLQTARAAWIAARRIYIRTEAYRYYGGPIDKLETRLNSWPVNEAYLDYVITDPKSGLVQDEKIVLMPKELLALNQKQDEADVTTGWHALEFMLWGQDLSTTGPGNRPYGDFVAGQPVNDRRRAYTSVLAQQILADAASLNKSWAIAVPNNYRSGFLKLPQREAIGRMVNGLAILTGYELMSERLTVGLDSGDQEDEQSCFSDTTKQDFVEDVAGIRAVWQGGSPSAPNLNTLLTTVDAPLAQRIAAHLEEVTALAAKLGDPWDQVLASPKGSPARQDAENFASALQVLSGDFSAAGQKLGVLVLIPSK